MKKIYLFTIIVIIIIGAVFVFRGKKEKSEVTPIKIKVAFIQNDLGSVLPFIALEKGYFQQEGLEIEPIYVNSGKEALNTLLSNDADLAIIAETPLAYLSFSDQSIQIISEVAQKRDHKILARKDRGINQLSDLRGKKIATPKGTSPEFALEKALKLVGINESDFELINLSPPNLLPALVNGDVDAYAIWEPHIQNGVKLLDAKSIIIPLKDFAVKISTAGKRSYLSNNSVSVKKFLTALLRSEQFLGDNLDDGQVIITKHIAIDQETLKLIWPDYIFRVQITPSLLSSLQEEGEWVNLQKPKTEQKPLPNYSEFINDGFLKEIDPSRIK